MRPPPARLVLLLASAALLLRLAGLGAGWLPPAAILLVVLLAGHAWRAAGETAPGTLGRHAWIWARAHAFGLAICGLALLGVSLRLTGVGADLGHIPPNIDENRLARSVLFFLRTGAIDHSTVEHYPGVLFWLLTASFLATYLAGLVAGTATRLGDVPIEQFLLIGRLTSVLVEAATIVTVGWLGGRLGGRGVGVVAALLMATSPLAVQISAQFRNDSSMVFLVTAGTAAAVAAGGSSRPVLVGLAAALAGLAAGVQYSGVFALGPVLVAAGCAGNVDGRMRRIGLAVVTFGLALAASNHFLWSDVPSLVRQLGDQIVITGEDHYAARLDPAWFYVATLGGRGVGWIWVGLGAALVVWGLSGRHPPAWILLAFPLCYLWFMPQRPAQFPRWVYPLVPSVAVAGSWGLGLGLAAARRRWAGRMAAPMALTMGGVVVAVALAQPLWVTADELTRRLAAPTHAKVETWLRDRVPAGDVVLVQRRWLALDDTRFDVRRTRDLAALLAGRTIEREGYDWIVVHEALARHPGLRRLQLVRSFRPDRRFGGNQGFDFFVYAPVPGHSSASGRDDATIIR